MGVGKVLWHSLTEDGKVERVNIKFGKSVYEDVDVRHLNPIDEGSHSHPKRKKNADKKKKKTESKMSLKLEELVGKKLTEEQFDEAAGKKDACYYKVKRRYDVWPSAYASGALVKCRKVGAKNWGNKSKKKEGVNETPQMAKQGQVGPLLKLANKQLQNVFSLHKKGKNKEAKVVFNNKVYSTLEYIHRAFDNVNESVNEKRGTCWVGYKQLGMKKKGDRMVPNCVKEIYYEENGKGYGYTFEFGAIEEAEYQGRKVKLNKIMQGDKKKFKVYVKNPKGNVVKVNFGQGGDAKGGTMRIRKSNPEARKSFRARHNCDNPGPKHKARYWSCRKW